MSWIGEQFNSITEKFTDFTKEVQDIGNQQDGSSREKLLKLCKEKDEKIQSLMEEKESFEKSIEELDQQHQEAIDELLSLKNNLILENNELKKRVSNQEKETPSEVSKNSANCFDHSNDGDMLKMKTSQQNNHQSQNQETDSLENFRNLMTILHSLKNFSGEDELNKHISWLKNQKQLLADEKSVSPKDNENRREKINYYLNCLDVMSGDNQTFLPFFEEIASLVNLLLVNNKSLKENLQLHENKMNNSNVRENFTNTEKHYLSDEACLEFSNLEIKKKDDSLDSSYQTDNLDLSNAHISKSDAFCQTDDSVLPEILLDSKGIQTEYSKCEGCLISNTNNDLISKLKEDIYELEQLNSSLKSENYKLSSVSVKNAISVQTDDLKCKCIELVAELEKTKSEFADLQIRFHEKEIDFNLSLKEQLDIVNDLKSQLKSKETVVSEKDNCIASQEKELSRLKFDICDMKSQLNIAQKERDYGKDVDTCDIGEIKNSPDKCINCKNVINMYNLQEQISPSSDNEKLTLQEKLKTSEFEKSKLLCVLSEKSQECSSLKAEVHKLTSIVASEKQALLKLQQDNCDLKQSSDNADPELTKEAVKKLGRLIRDKDFEIESLKQKNSTLTTLIAESSSIPEHIQSLMEERENLAKQINVFKADREKIMVSYNTKDQECRQYLADLKKVNSLLARQSEKFDILQQEHHSVAQQYEEKQKSLINTQNEMIALKQRVTDLEQQQVDIKEKYSELLNKINSDAMIQMTKEELNNKVHEIEKLTLSNEEKDGLIQEKDCMIHDLSQQIKTLKLEFEQEDCIISSLKKEIIELKDKLKEAENSMKQLQENSDITEQRLNDKNSELLLLKEMSERLNMGIKEKEYVIQSMTEKISSLSQYINSDHNSSEDTDINRILADSDSMFSKVQSLCRERDETLLSLSQSQQESMVLRNEMQKMKINEAHLKNELQRLREHLLQIEENYTTEALKAEEREKDLRNQLLQVSRRAEISSTAVVDTNQRASIQITSLQEQLRMIANQRDQALSQVSDLEDKVQQHSASINNLQFVLEQMQRGSEKKLKDTEKKWEALLKKEKEICKELENEVNTKVIQLEESSQALEAATRLSEQLDAKEEIISNLKNELSKTEHMIKSSAQEINSIKSNTEGKVDRVVMKSLVLGYFSTPPGQKSEVIRLLARVLDFNQEEMEKAGIIVQRNTGRSEQKGILSSIFNRWPLTNSNSQQSSIHNPQSQKSFTTLFVQFLENESQPIVPMPFPAEKMAQELTLKSQSSRKSQSPQKQLATGNSPLLLSIDSTFPSFTPVPAVEYTKSPAPSILKEMLE